MKRANQAGVAEQGFTINLFYERVLNLRTTDRRAFDALAPVTRHALNLYEQQKRQHALDEAMRNESRGRNEAA